MVSCWIVSVLSFASQGNLCYVSQVITACDKVVIQDERLISFVVLVTSNVLHCY